MTIETNHSIPVLERGGAASDEEDGLRERGAEVRMALGEGGGDGVAGLVPKEFADTPTIFTIGVDADFTGVGEDGRRKGRALTGGKENGEVAVEKLDVDVLFWLDVEGRDEEIVHLTAVALVEEADGDVVAGGGDGDVGELAGDCEVSDDRKI
jgi:hypothetical protein